jgi:glutaredoxin
MKITAYTTSNCFYCDQLKTLLRRANLEWENIPVTDEKERMEAKQKYPDIKGYPHVIIDGVEIGGLVNTAKFLVKKGLISAETK